MDKVASQLRDEFFSFFPEIHTVNFTFQTSRKLRDLIDISSRLLLSAVAVVFVLFVFADHLVTVFEFIPQTLKHFSSRFQLNVKLLLRRLSGRVAHWLRHLHVCIEFP